MSEQERRPSTVFAERLRELRQERALSLEQLAQLMRDAGFATLSKSAVLRIESGERGLSLDEALAFAAVLRAVPSQMLSPRDDEMVSILNYMSVDGGGMRSWLRFGAGAGDTSALPAERIEDLRLRAIAIHARALLDAIRLDDTPGKREALQAIADIFTAPGVPPAEVERRKS